MVVPSPAVETVVAPEPVAAPYQVTATSMEDLGEINAQRLSMMADVRNLSDQIARQRREAATLQDVITERLKQAAKLAGRS